MVEAQHCEAFTDRLQQRSLLIQYLRVAVLLELCAQGFLDLGQIFPGGLGDGGEQGPVASGEKDLGSCELIGDMIGQLKGLKDLRCQRCIGL